MTEEIKKDVLTDEETDKKLTEMSQQLNPEAVLKMKDVLQKIYEEKNIPFDVTHLKASLVMCNLIMPNLPPIFAEFLSSSILLHYRLIEEMQTGFVTSPIQAVKKNETDKPEDKKD